MTLISNKIFHDDGYFYKGNKKLFCNDPGTRDTLSDVKCTSLLQTTIKFEEDFHLFSVSFDSNCWILN